VDEVREWTVPGRVNLIGEHLDYNGGAVLPIAIDRAILIKIRGREDGLVNVWTGGAKTSFATSVRPGDVVDGAAYVAAAVWACRSAGVDVSGADIVIESSLPTGAGLASSAALTCGLAAAFDDLADAGSSTLELARIGQRAETDFIGAPVGLMDQLTVLNARPRHALHIDFAVPEPALTQVPAGWSDARLALAVVDTGVRHRIASGEYATRRDECARAAAELGVDRLAAAAVDAVLRLDDDIVKRRTRHVVTETARVRGALKALRTAEWTQFGAMLTASHASLRDDFEVSCPELDLAVETALESGAVGARMTGGGFGGSAIALLPADAVDSLRGRLEDRYARAGWTAPHVMAVTAVGGAARRA